MKNMSKMAMKKKMKKGGMPMTMKDGKKVPAFAADGKGPNDLGKAKMGSEMKPLMQMAKMGKSVDMAEPMMIRMDQAAYGMEKMMEGGMKKMKRGGRVATNKATKHMRKKKGMMKSKKKSSK